MKNSYYSLGIDIGGTNTVFGAISHDGLILKKDSILTNADQNPVHLFDKIFERNKVWIKELDNRYFFKNIGIGVPNGNYFTGMVKDPPNLGQKWQNLDLVKFVKKYQDIPVKITNDANAAALGEKSFGVAKEMKNAVVITLGTGLGSGLIIEGKVFYGHDGFAGELGHIIIDPKGRICECGRQGCLEMYVSAKGLKHTIDEYLSRYPNDKTLLNLKVNNFDGKKMDEAFDSGINIIQEIYEFTGNILGQGLAQASTILSPEAFIFYGGLSNAKHRILKFAKQSMDANLLGFQKNNIKTISLIDCCFILIFHVARLLSFVWTSLITHGRR